MRGIPQQRPPEFGTRSFSYTLMVIDPPDGRIPPASTAPTEGADAEWLVARRVDI